MSTQTDSLNRVRFFYHFTAVVAITKVFIAANYEQHFASLTIARLDVLENWALNVIIKKNWHKFLLFVIHSLQPILSFR